jgi:uracil-DNA glycosylase
LRPTKKVSASPSGQTFAQLWKGEVASPLAKRSHKRAGGSLEALLSQRAARRSSLAGDVPPAWRALLGSELIKPWFKALGAFVARERGSTSVLPPKSATFAALALTAPEKVRVVVVGQDPYPTRGNATGLAFSVAPGVPIPGSLKKIYQVLSSDLGLALPLRGDLTAWAKQGVLLLNAVLTVREGEPNSHRGRGWEIFTALVVKRLNEHPEPIAFLLLGAQAQKLAPLIDSKRHAIIVAPHPSRASSNNFLKSRPFSAINQALRARGRGEIDWQLQ